MGKAKPTDSDVAFIAALAEVLDSHNLTELDVERVFGADDKMTVRVTRASATTTVVQQAPLAAPAPVAAAPAPAPAAAPAAPAAEATADPAQDPNAVTSPMVGTAYLAPEEGAAPFVIPGDMVTEGQTLMIVEAMKTMNHIPAPRAGKVSRVLVENGSPVEYGAPLVILD